MGEMMERIWMRREVWKALVGRGWAQRSWDAGKELRGLVGMWRCGRKVVKSLGG